MPKTNSDIMSRIMARVEQDPQTGCLLWQGNTTGGGYGQLTEGRKVRHYVHRYVYENAHGPIPAGGVLTHTCGNRTCVALEHLRLTTRKAVAQVFAQSQRASDGT